MDPPPATASSIFPLYLSGSLAWASHHANPIAPALELLPGPLDTAWALYSFDLGGYEPTSVSIDCTLEDAANCWFVFANFADLRWEFVNAAGTDAMDIALPAGELSNPDGMFYCGLVSWGNSAVINSVSVGKPKIDWLTHEIVSGDADNYPTRFGGAIRIGDHIYVAYGYHNDSIPQNEIRLVRSTDPEPEAAVQWADSAVRYAGLNIIDKLVLADVAGLPALAWIIYDDLSIHYAWTDAPEPGGDPDWTVNNLGDADLSGLLDMTAIAGRPAIIYAETDISDDLVFEYAYSTIAQPASALDWERSDALVSSFNNFDRLELAGIGGLPVLAVNARHLPGFMYVRCDSTTPTAPGNWTTTLLQDYSPHVNGNLPSITLTEVGTYPAALYQSRTLGLMFATALQAAPDGVDDWTGHQLTDDVFTNQCLAWTPEGWLACCIDQTGLLQTFVSTTDTPQYHRDWRQSAIANIGTTTLPGIAAVATQGGTPLVIYQDPDNYSIRCARYLGE